jgi:hypothetical protein
MTRLILAVLLGPIQLSVADAIRPPLLRPDHPDAESLVQSPLLVQPLVALRPLVPP